MKTNSEKPLMMAKGGRLGSAEVGSVAWLALILPLVVEVPYGNLIVLLGVIVLCGLLFIRKSWEGMRFDADTVPFAVSMLALAAVQLFSCFDASSALALRFFVYSLGTVVFVALIANRMVEFNADFILVTGALAILVCLLEGMMGIRDVVYQNTVSGTLSFCCMGVLMAFMENRAAAKNPGGIFHWRFGMVMCSFVGSVAFILASQSRTALFVLGIMAAFLIILRMSKPNRRFLNTFFLIFIGCVVVFLFVYAHAKDFGWYADLNEYSQLLFGKNIDSSRGGLWEQSLRRVQGSELFGLGADASPVGVYEGRSFHNSFVQAYVQNGLVGLLCLISALFALWRIMASAASDPVVSVALAVLVGVVVYNCFESTLLSNKLSLGYLQWCLLALGVARSLAVRRGKKGAV